MARRPMTPGEFLAGYGPPRTTVPRRSAPAKRATAFAVMLLDVSQSPPQVEGVGVFSEPHPTMTGLNTRRQLVVAEGFGHDYEEGLRHLYLALQQPMHAWIWPLLDARARKSLGSRP